MHYLSSWTKAARLTVTWVVQIFTRLATLTVDKPLFFTHFFAVDGCTLEYTTFACTVVASLCSDLFVSVDFVVVVTRTVFLGYTCVFVVKVVARLRTVAAFNTSSTGTRL